MSLISLSDSVKIKYFDHQLVQDPQIRELVTSHLDYDWDNLIKWRRIVVIGNVYVRYGRNNLPFRNESLIDTLGPGPALEKIRKLSFSEALSDTLQLYKETKWDRPWILCWSGGIDSTAMVVSVLAGLSDSDRKNIRVAMDANSYYENPRFFHDHIEKNFEILHVHDINKHFDTCYVWNSGHADMLYQDSVRDFDPYVESLGHLNFHTNPGPLIEFLDNQYGEGFGKYLHQSVSENIDSLTIPINTYDQFFWWICFNQGWYYDRMSFTPAISGWFDSDQMQIYSLYKNLECVKETFKYDSRRYIYEYDNNQYYFNYKSKLGSSGIKFQTRLLKSRNLPIAALTDGRILHKDNPEDFRQLTELLPAHINKP